MPIKRPQLINGEIYHIVIRAIEGLKLFRDKKDKLRMIHDLFEFNDDDPVISTHRKSKIIKGTRTVLVPLKKKRKMLVEILAFCLMPNHVHLLVRQLREGGISKFMRKIGAGYGIYYNKKYKRTGHIFQGKYRIVHIKTQEQLKTVFVYIHSNPVSLIVPNWKEKGIKEIKKVINFLENYKWSSYPDYLEKKNFPSLTNREFLTKIMDGFKGCQEFVNGWLQFKKESADFNQVAIE
ncbi:MAG: transposase [Patescibacteria group bacterium]|nr:transposase [Patescibacteria group bacterium]